MGVTDWNIFKVKFSGQEASAFEQLAYNLFCEKFCIYNGLFRYKNQAGIETEPIEKDNQWIGFQAKFYETKLSENKQDIIASIKKGKKKNPNLNVIYVYVNREFSESSSIATKKPKYRIEIENEAQRLGISIEWQVPSHIERQLILPKNDYLRKHFFELGKSPAECIAELSEKSKNILDSINSEINFNGKTIKIDRSDFFKNINSDSTTTSCLVVSGFGGCGKTALIKDFYQSLQNTVPIYVFKATAFNVSSIDDFISPFHCLSLSDFIAFHRNAPKKYVVIDSAEKLSDLNSREPFNQFLRELSNNNWKIVFTTRYSYLDDLKYLLSQIYKVAYDVIHIESLSSADLNALSTQYGFTLPVETKFLDMLRNLFYLNEYLRYHNNIQVDSDYHAFRDTIWDNRIMRREETQNEIHLQREKCFLEIAWSRANSGSFYVTLKDNNPVALSKLRQDEVISRDPESALDFITHDIYEEWALDKIIQREYAQSPSCSSFFENIGKSLPIRRAFRNWLSEKIYDDVSAIKYFIDESYADNTITHYWKDEIWVSILLSDYSDTFFLKYENELIANEFSLLKRIIFLLRVACKEIDNSLTELMKLNQVDYVFTMPKGRGWESAIKFIYKHRSDISILPQEIFVPFLKEWVDKHKNGETTRFATLYALYIYQGNELKLSDKKYFSKEMEENVIKIITSGANEVKNELEGILQSIIDNKWKTHYNPYYDLSEAILKDPSDHFFVIILFPQKIIALCDLFWRKIDDPNDRHVYGRGEIEDHYKISNNMHLDYFPPSALQTPVYLLLKFAPHSTIGFLIKFVNESVADFANSQYAHLLREVCLDVDGIKHTQYINDFLWQMYRGGGHMATPYLLQSIHMALEKYLQEVANTEDSIHLEPILKKLLKESSSASLTAIVCSIVLAHPEKFYNVALTLFKTPELFHCDNMRCMQESSTKRLYAMSTLPHTERFSKERLATCDEAHRHTSLEFLCLKMQYEGVKGLPEEDSENLIRSIYDIIDSHKKLIDPSLPDSTLRFLLGRIDRRNLKPEVKETDAGVQVIELVPQLDPALKAEGEKTREKLMHPYRYTILRSWADFLSPSKNGEALKAEFEKYDNSPSLCLKQVEEIMTELKSEECSEMFYFTNYSIPGYVCSKLIIKCRDRLSKKDKHDCRDVIKSCIFQLFSNNYDAQIGDGVEAAIHAIPYLIEEYPEERDMWLSFMLLVLFNRESLGSYKRICDYALEAISDSDLWNKDFDTAQSLLFAFIKLKPIYNSSRKSIRKGMNFGQATPNETVLEVFYTEVRRLMGSVKFESLSFDIKNMDSLSIEDMDSVIHMIPSDTSNAIHKEIVKYVLPKILPDIMSDRRERRDSPYNIDYGLPRRFFRNLAKFLLNREVHEITEFMIPCIENMQPSDETATFYDNLVSAEDENYRYEQFWAIWKQMLPKYLEISKNHRGHYFSKITHSYLLAWPYWRAEIQEWHGLKESEIGFYKEIAEQAGNHPAVLDSISQVLNGIGNRFVNDGISWLSTIIMNNKGLESEVLETNTVYYIEKIIRKYTYLNRERIKRDVKLKTKILIILDFLVARGSVQGYLLREDVV